MKDEKLGNSNARKEEVQKLGLAWPGLLGCWVVGSVSKSSTEGRAPEGKIKGAGAGASNLKKTNRKVKITWVRSSATASVPWRFWSPIPYDLNFIRVRRRLFSKQSQNA
jgi:hypothetical protein